jgi:hypothetical protein
MSCGLSIRRHLVVVKRLTRLLLLVELSAWTSCLSNFTETGVKVGIAGEGGSSRRSSFTIGSDSMALSMGGRDGSRTIRPWIKDKM